jgi:Family of unknown function (DUF5681)
MSKKDPWREDGDGRANNQPPEHSRFKPGHTGNPKGRKKGARNRATLFNRFLNEQVEIREGDRVRKMSKREAIYCATVHRALKGDPKAIKIINELTEADPSSLQPPPPIYIIFGDKPKKPPAPDEYSEEVAAQDKQRRKAGETE